MKSFSFLRWGINGYMTLWVIISPHKQQLTDLWASLKGDRKRRVEIAGEEVETLLGEDPPNSN